MHTGPKVVHSCPLECMVIFASFSITLQQRRATIFVLSQYVRWDDPNPQQSKQSNFVTSLVTHSHTHCDKWSFCSRVVAAAHTHCKKLIWLMRGISLHVHCWKWSTCSLWSPIVLLWTRCGWLSYISFLTRFVMKALDLFLRRRSTDLLNPCQAASWRGVLPYYKIEKSFDENEKTTLSKHQAHRISWLKTPTCGHSVYNKTTVHCHKPVHYKSLWPWSA